MSKYLAIPLFVLGCALSAGAQDQGHAKGKAAAGPTPPVLNKPNVANPGPLPRDTPKTLEHPAHETGREQAAQVSEGKHKGWSKSTPKAKNTKRAAKSKR